MLDKKYTSNNWIIGTEIFWNKTNRMYFSESSSNIESYLALNEKSFLEKLEPFLERVRAIITGFNIDNITILSLFKNGAIEQRQAGFLFYINKSFNKWNFSIKTPFYYLERNYNFTDKEKEAIEQQFGKADPNTEHLFINDKIGTGDTRISFHLPLQNSRALQTNLGLFATIPTAKSFAKAIIGSSYSFIKERPTIDLVNLFNLGTVPETKDEAQEIALNFFLDSFEHMSANFLNAPLGNNGHVSIGIFTKSITPLSVFIKRAWAENILFKSFISLEYLFPGEEKRLFIELNDARLFDARDFDDVGQSTSNLAFLEQQFVDKFFPFVYDTTVCPGFILQWASKATYESEKWGCHFGTDLWVKTEESFGSIGASKQVVERLRKNKAKRFLGYQSKVLTTLFYKKEKKNKIWIFSLHGDGTIMSSGIGKDYTISLNIETDF